MLGSVYGSCRNHIAYLFYRCRQGMRSLRTEPVDVKELRQGAFDGGVVESGSKLDLVGSQCAVFVHAALGRHLVSGIGFAIGVIVRT